MQVVEQLPSFEVPRRRSRRHRSRKNRVFRNFRRSLRHTRLGKVVFSLFLIVGAVIGGYKASVYVASQNMPSVEELSSGPHK